jgi:TolA-binding protein
VRGGSQAAPAFGSIEEDRMKPSRILVLSLAAAAGMLGPDTLLAQRREDFIALQRDVAQLQEQMRQMQRAQDEKLAALTALVQQAVDASGKLSSGLTTLQQNVGTTLSDQQGKVAGSLAALNTKTDQHADGLRSVREEVEGLQARFNKLDSALSDISSAVRTLSAPPVAPPPTETAGGGLAPPPGMSAEGSYQTAYRDFSAGRDELAMNEFTEYLKYFMNTENGPAAQYYIGMIYDRANQYEDAVKAFDAVIERYPENPKTPEALYMKGVALLKGGRRTDAATEFRAFLMRYPAHENAPKAEAHLKSLGMSVPARKKK